MLKLSGKKLLHGRKIPTKQYAEWNWKRPDWKHHPMYARWHEEEMFMNQFAKASEERKQEILRNQQQVAEFLKQKQEEMEK